MDALCNCYFILMLAELMPMLIQRQALIVRLRVPKAYAAARTSRQLSGMVTGIVYIGEVWSGSVPSKVYRITTSVDVG